MCESGGMKESFGMPGPGGSLGECAICGESFLLEIITGGKVKTIQIDGVDQILHLHEKCVPLIKDGMDWHDLPDASPLKQAFLKTGLC